MKIVYISLVAGLGLAAIACAGAPQPTERLASAQAAVRTAKELGAKDVPQAQLHTQLAEEQVQQATKLMHDGDNERADHVLKRAQADAELAVALAREAESQKGAEAAEAALSPAPGTPPQTMQATTK
jgi:Zn-dependent alcohol dehydrogenase